MKQKSRIYIVLFLTLLAQLSFAQERTVKGNVTDNNGIPLPGVSVLIKNTTTGTETDFDGNFSINAQANQTLVFSYVGMNKQEIIASSNNIKVVMTENAEELEGVVVTALGIKRKPDELTTASQNLKASELTQGNNPNVVQGLAGKVSGLQLNTTSSGLTPNTSIILRGTRTISGNPEALVVIDNIVSNATILANLDPNTIESINVLKGANGAALYGADGANGVLIVTTKKGSKGESKFSVDIKSAVSFEQIAFLPTRQNRFGQGWEGNLDWTDQGAWGPEFDGSSVLTGTPYPGVNDWRYAKYEHINDHLKPFFNTGVTLQNTITISAGDENGHVSLSANKQNIDGVIPNNQYIKDFFDFNAGKKLGRFTINGTIRYTTDKTNRATNNTYFNLSQGATNINVEDFSSGDNYDNWTLYADSPFWSMNNQRTNINSNTFDGSSDIQYSLNSNINFILRSSVRIREGSTMQYTNEFEDLLVLAGTNRSIRSRYDKSVSQSRFIYNDFLTNFDYDLSENWKFNATVGVNTTETKTRFNLMGGSDLLIPGFYHISNISGIPDVDEQTTTRRAWSLLSNVDLGYKDYLFFNLTGRYDNLSVLPKDSRSFFYPSAGISFVPTKAFPSIQSDVLHKLKFSGSHVIVGNASAISPHQLNETAFQPNGFPFNDINTFILSNETFDQNLTPEFITSSEINASVELFKKGSLPRLTIDASASFIKTTDQILSISPSYTSGANTAFINVGDTQTKAFEVDLGFTPIATENFKWSGTIGFSTYKTVVNKVTDQSSEILTGFFENAAGNQIGTIGLWAVEGEEFPLIRGTGYERDNEGRVILDNNGNPIISSELKTLGKVNPDYVINFNTQFKYKNITLGATLDYRTGHQFYSNTANDLNAIGGTIESAYNGRQPFIFPNSSLEVSPGVYEANNSVLTGGNTAASFQSYVSNNYGFFDENFVLDATAVKLRELYVSYDLPSKYLQDTFFQKISLGVTGRNLYTWLPRANRGYNDPEIGTGLETWGQTPPTRFYTFNVNFVF